MALWLAAVTLGVALFFLVFYVGGVSQLREFARLPLPDMSTREWPRVSVIICALNEEATIERGLESILALNYPNLEIILIDDRSTDRTGLILDNMAAMSPHLKVFHLTELPKGWLGKNHAMAYGAKRAVGDYLLFTDADVVLEKNVLLRAINHMQTQPLDHLTSSPFVDVEGFWINLSVAMFTIFFNIYMRPWKARDPKSKAGIGIGAFNLMTREIYERMGTIKAIAMRPDEDIRMGMLLKSIGARQELVVGKNVISVKWYETVSEMIHGLEKNIFAGLNYNFWLLVFFSIPMTLFCIVPLFALFLTTGVTQLMYVLTILCFVGFYYVTSRYRCGPWWPGFFFSIGSILHLYIMWRSTLKTLRQRGIYWRGTFYSLRELKA